MRVATSSQPVPLGFASGVNLGFRGSSGFDDTLPAAPWLARAGGGAGGGAGSIGISGVCGVCIIPDAEAVLGADDGGEA